RREAGVLFTRTLRRKLLAGVGLVLGMLAILSTSGILGLRSYRESIRDLEFHLHKAPQQAALEHAIASLFEPLLEIRDERDRLQQDVRDERIAELRRSIDEYHRRADDLPAGQGPASPKAVTDALLLEIEFRFRELDRLREGLPDSQRHAEFVAHMKHL